METSEVHVPPDTAPRAAETPPPPAPKRRRWLEVVGAIAIALVALAGLGYLVEPDAGTDGVVFEEDFAQEPYGLSTDSDRFVELAVVDERYRVTIHDGTGPQLARHVFSHTYDAVSLEASVTHPTDMGDSAFAAVGCWAGDSSYLLLLSSGGEAGLLETISESTGERRPLTELEAQDAARPAGEPNRLRIECVGGGTRPTLVSGYLNGEPIFSVAVPDGYDSFNAVGFLLVAEDSGRFWIDDVVARNERRSPSLSPVAPVDPAGG
jgi:hypothetical protein